MINRRRAMQIIGGGAAAGLTALAGCSSRSSSSVVTSESVVEKTEEVTNNGREEISVGVFLGDEAALEPWEEWFGRPVDHYSLIVPHDRWESYRVENMPIEVPISQIAASRDISISVRMFPPSESSLQAVANGEHADQHREFARSLVDNNMADARIRIGAELNGQWAKDGAVGRPNTFIQAWKQTVRVLDDVNGAEFEYMWAPHIGRVDMKPTLAYPGDKWVNHIGLTVYDASQFYFPSQCNSSCVRQRREKTWEMIVSQEYGLDFWAQYAREHKKPLWFPEYGVVARGWNDSGGGDNPLFFKWLAQWMDTNRDIVRGHTSWSFVAGPHYVGPEAIHSSNEYPPHPNASKVYKSLFSDEH